MQLQTIIILFVLFGNPLTLSSYTPGISGRTLKTTNAGCGASGCHGSSASSSVVVTINGPSSLGGGQTGSYTVTVNDISSNTGGVNIAISSGTLSPVSTFLQLSNDELIHKQKITVPSTYQFNYTAPTAPGDIIMYVVAKGSGFNSWNWASNKIISVTTTGVEHNADVPHQFNISQNYPNPFNPLTNFTFDIASISLVNLKIFNSTGQEVAVLLNEQKSPGKYSVSWNASGRPSGVYMYQFNAGNFKAVKKMLFLK